MLSEYDWRAVGVYGAAMLCALLGFADDSIRSCGAARWGSAGAIKLGVQILISLGLWYVATRRRASTDAAHPHVDYPIDLGFVAGIPFLIMIYIVVAGTTNAVNLTDGLDGLAAGCAAIALLAYIGITCITTGLHDLTLLSGCLVGACVGFSGSTRSRRRSSWATPARSGSAARSPASRS